MSVLKQRLIDDMKAAMRAKDSPRLEVIRMLRAAVQRKELDNQRELDNDQVLAVVQKQIKQAKDSITQFEKGGRPDLVQKEQYGVKIMQAYLPEQLSEQQIKTLVDRALKDTQAKSIKDMGQVMAWISPKVQGQADMGLVSRMIKSALNSDM